MTRFFQANPEVLSPDDRSVVVRHMEMLERQDRHEKRLLKVAEVVWSLTMLVAGLVLGICLCSGSCGGR